MARTHRAKAYRKAQPHSKSIQYRVSQTRPSSRKKPRLLSPIQKKRRLGGWVIGSVVGIVLLAYIVSAQTAAMGEKALANQQFDAARQHLELAQILFPLRPRQSQLDQVSRLETSEQYYQRGLQAFRNRQWAQASTDFSQTDPDDSAYTKAQAYLVTISRQQRQDKVSGFLAQARQFLAQRDFVQALSSLSAINPTDTGYEVAKQLRASIQLAENQLAVLPANFQIHLPILMYHYISKPPQLSDATRVDLSVEPDVFARQMAYLASHGFTTVTMGDVDSALAGKTTLPSKSLVLTFDDGYRDFYTNAYPVLRQYRFKATIYVVTGFVGQPAYLTWPMIREMVASGLVTVGSHTLDHADLPYKDTATIQRELTESRQILSAQLGRPITSFCYPYGGFTPDIVKAVRQAGYIDATTTKSGSWHSPDSLLTLTRVRIKNQSMAGYTSFLNG